MAEDLPTLRSIPTTSAIPDAGGTWRVGAGRRRDRRDALDEDRHWAPKWRRLLAQSGGEEGLGKPPGTFEEFDRTVRGMLNRISSENAERLLPLDPSLRCLTTEPGGGDSPPWWAARFAALMLTSYLQVIHTNRCARGLAMRSADNILPAYLDAVAPLLVRSPRLVEAVMSYLARMLRVHDLCWPTLRLVLLAAREPRERSTLACGSLGALPAELLRGRILHFLAPPGVSSAAVLMPADATGSVFAGLFECWDSEDGRRDAAAVLAHVLVFTPSSVWPQLSAFAFFVIEAALSTSAAGGGHASLVDEGRIYLAASVLVAVAQRLEAAPREVLNENAAAGSTLRAIAPSRLQALRADLGILGRTVALLQRHLPTQSGPGSVEISAFVRTRAQAAVELCQRTQEIVQSLLT